MEGTGSPFSLSLYSDIDFLLVTIIISFWRDPQKQIIINLSYDHRFPQLNRN